MIHKITMAAFVAALTLGVAACDNKGPAEQVGEEVDEAVDTIKNGGQESTSSKVDDAVDDIREGTKDAADEVKK